MSDPPDVVFHAQDGPVADGQRTIRSRVRDSAGVVLRAYAGNLDCACAL